MFKKTVLVLILVSTLAMAGPSGEAQAATNTATQVQVQQAAQAALATQVQAELDALELARPAGWWGWTMCLTSVAAFAASNGFAAYKVAKLVKAAGSIRAAVAKQQARISKLSKARKQVEVRRMFLGVIAEIFAVDAIVDNCFN